MWSRSGIAGGADGLTKSRSRFLDIERDIETLMHAGDDQVIIFPVYVWWRGLGRTARGLSGLIGSGCARQPRLAVIDRPDQQR